MAWQGEGRQRQIPAKAVFRPVERDGRVLAMRHHPTPNRVLAGFLGGLAAILKRRITVDWPSLRSNKIEADNQSPLMIAENLAGGGGGGCILGSTNRESGAVALLQR